MTAELFAQKQFDKRRDFLATQWSAATSIPPHCSTSKPLKERFFLLDRVFCGLAIHNCICYKTFKTRFFNLFF